MFIFILIFKLSKKSTFLKGNCLLYSQINCLCHLAVIILVDKVHVKPPQGGENPIVVVNFVFVECKKSFLPATMTLPHNSTMFTGIKKEKKKERKKISAMEIYISYYCLLKYVRKKLCQRLSSESPERNLSAVLMTNVHHSESHYSIQINGVKSTNIFY